MKILVISDAWRPQINGVVRTYEWLAQSLHAAGHDMHVIGPQDFPHRMKMPGYPEIELALFAGKRLARLIEAAQADTIHIATEGPLGRQARHYCKKHKIPFTSCYHTQFPQYVAKRVEKYFPAFAPFAEKQTFAMLRRFHGDANVMMVATQSLEDSLRRAGFTVPMAPFTRGVDLDLFKPGDDTSSPYAHLAGPVALYVGRVAIEKNLEAFLSMNWHGAKAVVGTGPDLAHLQKKYPDVFFAGKQTGERLATHYRQADIFVFPSRTDTFGMVITEALACGLPVAAYKVTGPVDIITNPILGALDDDLAIAAHRALTAPGTRDQRHKWVATHYSWPRAAAQFIENTGDYHAYIHL